MMFVSYHIIIHLLQATHKGSNRTKCFLADTESQFYTMRFVSIFVLSQLSNIFYKNKTELLGIDPYLSRSCMTTVHSLFLATFVHSITSPSMSLTNHYFCMISTIAIFILKSAKRAFLTT